MVTRTHHIVNVLRTLPALLLTKPVVKNSKKSAATRYRHSSSQFPSSQLSKLRFAD